MCKKIILNGNHNSLDNRFMDMTEYNWVDARKTIKFHSLASHTYIQKSVLYPHFNHVIRTKHIDNPISKENNILEKQSEQNEFRNKNLRFYLW